MASITIRHLDDDLKSRLRVRAAEQGRSMEDEAREILRSALNVKGNPPRDLSALIRSKFAPLGGIDLPLAPREPMRAPPEIEP